MSSGGAPGKARPLGPAIGIFGGTFDPVHYGHLRAALEALEQLAIEDFRLLPAGTPPHRESPVASAEHRLAMLRLAIDGVPGLRWKVSDGRAVRLASRSSRTPVTRR